MKLAVITINSDSDYNQWRDYDAEYISFVPAGTRLEDDYFFHLTQVYIDRPLYRKISMVSPVVSVPAAEIYSWSITDKGYEPSAVRRSKEPYTVQISYLPGAVIKRTALQKLNPTFSGDAMQDSIDFSLALWESGLRPFVDPDVTIETSQDLTALGFSHEPMTHLQEMFKREYIR